MSTRRMWGLASRTLAAVTLVVASGTAAVVLAPSAAADGPTTFTNSSPIAVPSTTAPDQTGLANPYPSAIAVSGLTGTVTKVTVAFNGLTHGALNDVDALLVAPTGANLLVMSDVGNPLGLNTAANATLTFDDAAAGVLPGGAVPTGTYKPTNVNDGLVD